MIEATVLGIALSFATIWYLLCHFVLKAFGLPLVGKINKGKQTWTEKRLKRLLLNINAIIASIFLGMLSAISCVQFVIARSIYPTFILNHINYASLMFASSIFNAGSIISIFSLLILSAIIYFSQRIHERIEDERLDNETEAIPVSEFDEIKAEKAEQKKHPEAKETVQSKALTASTAKGKLSIHDGKKRSNKADLVGKGALLGALVSPRQIAEPKDKDKDKTETRAEFKKKQAKENTKDNKENQDEN